MDVVRFFWELGYVIFFFVFWFEEIVFFGRVFRVFGWFIFFFLWFEVLKIKLLEFDFGKVRFFFLEYELGY